MVPGFAALSSTFSGRTPSGVVHIGGKKSVTMPEMTSSEKLTSIAGSVGGSSCDEMSIVRGSFWVNVGSVVAAALVCVEPALDPVGIDGAGDWLPGVLFPQAAVKGRERHKQGVHRTSLCARM